MIKIFNKESIIRIDFNREFGNGRYEEEWVALYNRNKTSDETAKKAVFLCGLGSSDEVVFMTKKQFEIVFDD